MDGFNPTLAARLVAPLGEHARYVAPLAGAMRGELRRILGRPGLSKNVLELAGKALEAGPQAA